MTHDRPSPAIIQSAERIANGRDHYFPLEDHRRRHRHADPGCARDLGHQALVEMDEVMTAPKQSSSGKADALDGLAERLDRLLLTSQENDRFVLSTESAKNIVGIVREWIRSRERQADRGRHYDIIQEAFAKYDEWLLDDDFNATRALQIIIDRMRERVEMTDAPQPVSVAQAGNDSGNFDEALRTFFSWAMRNGPWDGCELDGGDVQDKAEHLGLIVKTKFDPARHQGFSEFRPGDDFYEFAPGLMVPSTPDGSAA